MDPDEAELNTLTDLNSILAWAGVVDKPPSVEGGDDCFAFAR